MEQIPLVAQKRTVLGRKVKKLRAEGLIPAHVFGHKVKTIHVQIKENEFKKVFEKAGETGIVNLKIDSENRPVLIRNVHVHPVTDDLLHIDLYQVNLAEKVKVDIPLTIINESPAVEKKVGLLLTPVSEIEIEALPTEIPDKITVDIAVLANIGDEIKVKDLQIDRNKIKVNTDENLIVAQIGELVTKEMEAVEAEIEAEQAEAVEEKVAEEGAPAEGEEAKEAAAEEGAEAAAKPEGQEKKEETKPEEKPQEE